MHTSYRQISSPQNKQPSLHRTHTHSSNPPNTSNSHLSVAFSKPNPRASESAHHHHRHHPSQNLVAQLERGNTQPCLLARRRRRLATKPTSIPTTTELCAIKLHPPHLTFKHNPTAKTPLLLPSRVDVGLTRKRSEG